MNTNKNYTIVAKKLIQELTEKITGNDEEWLFGKIPSKHVMIGMIDGGQKEESFLMGKDVNDDRRETIPSIGLRFRLQKEISKIKIQLQGKFFFRIEPSFDEQVKYMLDTYSKKEGINFNDIDCLLKYLESNKENPEYIEPKEGIANIYKSVNLSDLGEFSLNIDDFENSVKQLNSYLSQKLDSLIDGISDISIGCKKVERPISSLLDKNKYDAILKAAAFKVKPNWKIELYATVDTYEKYNEVVIQLINVTEKNNLNNSYETPIFNGGLILTSERGFLPIKLNSLKHYYLDNPTMPGIGNNCSVKRIGDKKLITENIPMYVQNRVITIDKFNRYLEFEKMMSDPLSNLKYIKEEMSKKLTYYKNELSDARGNHFSDEYIRELEKEIIDFEHESFIPTRKI